VGAVAVVVAVLEVNAVVEVVAAGG